MDRELVTPARAPGAEAPGHPRAGRRALLVALHFPPQRGSSGMQRTLRFARHLPKFGWQPIVLSIHPSAYEEKGGSGGNEVPPDLTVYRAFGINAATRLSFFGRYPQFLALPDRWASWRYWAVPKALDIIRKHQVDAIWTTFPIATAHRIGLEVARRSGLPWIAEFRDPMWQWDWPQEPTANANWRRLEEQIFRAVDCAVFTAPSAVKLYAERYPHFRPSRLAVIENGYDEETFARAEAGLSRDHAAERSSRPLRLLHSGIIYRSERDPTHFFAAVAALKRAGRISAAKVQILLRASGGEGDYLAELQRTGIDDIVRLEPSVDYLEALREMLTVDGLLLLQAANCNAQIPAKLYEYLRARRPILALTDPDGDTARTLQGLRTGRVARLDSSEEIQSALMQFLEDLRAGNASMPGEQEVARYSRESRAGELAALFERAISGGFA